MSSGERPIGAAKGKQPNAEALCHPPLPHLRLLLGLCRNFPFLREGLASASSDMIRQSRVLLSHTLDAARSH